MALTKEKFLAIYSNLPINARKEIIVVLDKNPITWNVAYLEISGNTALGKEILKMIDSLGVIDDK